MWWLTGCAPPDPPAPRTCPCSEIAADAPVTDEAGLVALLASARQQVFPELAGVAIGVAPVEDLAFFRAWVELDTVALDDGRARDHTVQYDPIVLSDPPPAGALAALLVHELAHVADYVGWDSAELVEFGVWYGTADPMTSDELSAYERQTDETALRRGCAEGLAAAREWIYAHSDPEVLAEKQRNYWTPAEIDAWTRANGACVQGD